ncbi:MAG: hypothetical protein U1E65_16475 [Myxococcota bacterium]
MSASLGIPLLAVIMASAVAAAHAWASGRAAIAALVGLCFLGLSYGLGAAGVFERAPPLMFGFVLVALALAGTRAGTAAAERVPLALLVGLQAFRLPLELVMHGAAEDGLMPVQMSYSGLNFDILSGISALLIGLGIWRGWLGRRAAIAFNLLGIALLLNIVSIAVASLPRFHAFGTDPARINTWVLGVPYVWLPTILVAAAAHLHLLLSRRLWGRAR